jgi:hypothetical protein
MCICWDNLLNTLRAMGCLCADHLRLQPIADCAPSVFSSVHSDDSASGFLFVAECVVRNCSTQFFILLRSGTFPCLVTLYCLNIPWAAITESLVFKSVWQKHGGQPTTDSCSQWMDSLVECYGTLSFTPSPGLPEYKWSKSIWINTALPCITALCTVKTILYKTSLGNYDLPPSKICALLGYYTV